MTIRYRYVAQLLTGKTVEGDWQAVTKEQFQSMKSTARDGIFSGKGGVAIEMERYPVVEANFIPVAAIACLTIESRNA
jgi:hypothetical protein